MSLVQWALLFLAATAVLVRAGIALARAGDEIATRTRLGGLLVGMLLMAAATSLPEAVTVISAAATGAPDLAVGGVFGSSMGNMAVLAVIDLVHRRHRVWTLVELGQARVASVAIALTGLATVGAATPEGFTFGWVGFDTVLVAVGYVAALGWIRRSPQPAPARVPTGPFPQPTEIGVVTHPSGAVRQAAARFAVASLAVLASGPLVTLSAERIARDIGLAETFAGVTLLAVATSLPELVTSLGAVRIGSYDLAVGNLFGSNAVNLIMLLGADLVYTKGPILSGAHPAQVVAGVAAMGLMAVALAAIVHGEETRISRLEPDALLLLLAYAGSLAAVWATAG
ncbi:MAG: sodium:calcium antiporter [Actinomycetota bacterium]